MASSSDDDSQQNFILGFLLALIALVIFFVIGIVLWQRSQSTAPAVAPVAAAAVPDGASIRVDGGIVSFYFASGSADVAPGAAAALAAVVKGVQEGHQALVSGFHDATGDASRNAELAKKRAETVRDVLAGLGVPADKIELRKPEVTAGSGNDAEARRVEVKLD